jgi:hypothetical protein
MRNLEHDLMNSDIVRNCVHRDRGFADELYAALCNNQFRHIDMPDDPEVWWSCTWRYAAGIVADIDDANGDYLDFYCAGNEGTISPRIEQMLFELGWSGRPWTTERK